MAMDVILYDDDVCSEEGCGVKVVVLWRWAPWGLEREQKAYAFEDPSQLLTEQRESQ
jgi:hypothetical protein